MKLFGGAVGLVRRDEAFIREFRVIRVFRGSLFLVTIKTIHEEHEKHELHETGKSNPVSVQLAGAIVRL